MDFYLGITGLPGTGKEAVSQLIAAQLAGYGIQTRHYSLSGPIDLERRRRGLPDDREQLRLVANEMRANLGNGVWAARIAREIQEALSGSEWTDVFVMIDGVRNPAEITVFQQLWGSRFHLLAVNAPEEVRRLNLTARSSPKDAAVLRHLANAIADSAAIAPVLTAEMGIGQPQHGTNVLACIELADWTLDNAEYDAGMLALRSQVKSLVERSVLPLYRRTSALRVDGLLAQPAQDGGRARGAAARALVVESDPAWQEKLAVLLEQEGCAVEFAADYAEASRKLLAQPARMPYVVLTVDLQLPGEPPGGTAGLTGFDLLQSLHYFDRSLPTIIVSAHSDAQQVGRAFRDFDVQDYFAKQAFAAQSFRSRLRSILQMPFYAVATLEVGVAEHLLVGRPCTLSIRVQREAPPHQLPRRAALRLWRPPTPAEWPLAVVARSPDLRMEWQPRAEQLLLVPADYLAEPLTYTFIPLTAGKGRLEIEFHQPGAFVERLALDVAVRAE